MEVNSYAKFKILFRRILEEDYQLSQCYAEKVVKCLEDPNDNVGKKLLDTPIFSDLILHSIGNIQKVSVPSKIFIFQVITVLFRNELQFNKLNYQGFQMSTLKECVNENLNSTMPSGELHLAFLKLVTTLISHSSGIKLIILKKPWERALFPGLLRKPAHVSKAVYDFLSKLVWKLDEYEDETTLYEVLRAILKPILTSDYQTLEVFDAEKEYIYSESVLAPLHAMLAILAETHRVANSKCFIPILKHCYFIEAPTPKLLSGTRDAQIIYLIAHINFHFHFAVINRASSIAGRTESDFMNEMIVCFVNALTMLITEKQMIEPILEFVVNINIFWAKTGSKLYPSSFDRNGLKYEMENQFLWHLMLPTITYVMTKFRTTSEEFKEYSANMGQMLTEQITKSGYRYRTMLQRSDSKKIAIQNMKMVFKMKGLLKSKQAGTLFKGLFYLMQTFVIRGEIPEACSVTLIVKENPLQTSDDVKLLSLTLAAIKMLLTEHNINWYENLEIICLQNGLIDLMKQEYLPTKQLLQVFDLLELSTKKFLSPDMTLLVESKHGSALSEMMGLMRHYIRHEDWEVRDSALSLLLACTHIAFVKYVPLQKLILENNLLILASKAAITDTEYYVQATALKCLAAATKIESLWREVLHDNDNIYTQLIHILRHDPEGMVRTEAANVLTQYYSNHNTSQAFQKCMYDVMTSAAIDDLHWEVQLAALRFWKQVIKTLLNDRGMMDGTFPKVTFSKEKRKIIVLDEKEVKRQLTSLLNDLSANCCLTVLSECINEEFNIEVMEQAQFMSSKLIEILTRYNFDWVPENSYNCPMDSDARSELEDEAMDLSLPDNTAKRDDVIDEIINTKTSKLIMNLNNENATSNPDLMEQDSHIAFKERIHPNKFLENFKQTDYKTIIDNFKNWKLEAPKLSELLDEIVGDISLEMSESCIE